MVESDSYISEAAYLSAVVTYIVLLTLGLIGNAAVLGINLIDVRRLPGHPHHITVNMNQIAIGLPCIANLVIETCAVAWFTYVGIIGVEYRQYFQPACGIVSVLFVWTSMAYLMGLLTMSVDRVVAVRRHRLRLPDSDGHRSIQMTTRGVWLTVVGSSLYATSVCVVLSTSKVVDVSMKMICTVRVDDRLEMCRIPKLGNNLLLSNVSICMANYEYTVSPPPQKKRSPFYFSNISVKN